MGLEAMQAVRSWAEPALRLPAQGMPQKCFQLLINGSTRETREVWDVIKHAAMLHEAMLAWGEYHDKLPGPAEDGLLSNSGQYPLPWRTPSHLPQLVRDIMEGSSLVRITEVDKTPWDAHAFFAAHKDWKEHDWRMEQEEKVTQGESSTEFMRDPRARYRIGPDTEEP